MHFLLSTIALEMPISGGFEIGPVQTAYRVDRNYTRPQLEQSTLPVSDATSSLTIAQDIKFCEG